MRKQFKNKKASCALCKPHKRGWASRWKPAERAAQVAFERERRLAEFGDKGR